MNDARLKECGFAGVTLTIVLPLAALLLILQEISFISQIKTLELDNIQKRMVLKRRNILSSIPSASEELTCTREGAVTYCYSSIISDLSTLPKGDITCLFSALNPSRLHTSRECEVWNVNALHGIFHLNLKASILNGGDNKIAFISGSVEIEEMIIDGEYALLANGEIKIQSLTGNGCLTVGSFYDKVIINSVSPESLLFPSAKEIILPSFNQCVGKKKLLVAPVGEFLL